MIYRDEFDEPPRGPNILGGIGSKAAFLAVLIALSFMVGVVWKLYVGNGDSQGQNVPIVRADEESFKVIPDDPGGMEIPNRDSTIFSSLKSSDKEGETRIENLLADNKNEEPLPRSQLFAGLNTHKSPTLSLEAKDSPLDKPVGKKVQKEQLSEKEVKKVIERAAETKIEEAALSKVVVPKKVEPVVKPETVQKKVAPKVAPVPKAKVKPKVKPVFKPKAKVKSKSSVVPVEAAPLPTAGDYYIQLGSVKSLTGAEGEWKKIKKRYSSQLSGFSHRVETADLGAKGVFYRIQAGPVSKKQALSTCGAIKKITAGGCLVKKNK